jgi:hypothetical protein
MKPVPISPHLVRQVFDVNFRAETFIKGSQLVTLANWQMCGEANAKIVLR